MLIKHHNLHGALTSRIGKTVYVLGMAGYHAGTKYVSDIPKGSDFGYVEDPRCEAFIPRKQEGEYFFIDPVNTCNTCSTTTGAEPMNGAIYSGVVVRTRTVPAGEGVSTGVQKSDIVHSMPNFVALNDEAAKAIILADAINKLAGKLDVSDPASPVEVKIQKLA